MLLTSGFLQVTLWWWEDRGWRASREVDRSQYTSPSRVQNHAAIEYW